MTTQLNTQSKKNQLPDVILKHHGKVLFKRMEEWQTRQQIPPVLLLTGQSGIGKSSIAHFLAQWILCEQAGFKHGSLFPCETCPACVRIQSKTEVNLTVISSDSEDDSESTSKALKIEQFRNLKTSAGFGAFEGSYRIFLVPAADRMTNQAANSVLKLLEEPPPGWIFFLTANDPTLLLPTILSRCQMIRLKPFSNEEILTLLKSSKLDSQKQKVCAELSQGSWNRALTFAEDEIWEQRKVILQFFKNPMSVMQSLLDWTSQKPNHFDIFLDLLEQYTSELIHWSISEKSSSLENYSWAHSDSSEALSSHAKQMLQRYGNIEQARSFWISKVERISKARIESQAPLNRKILIQDLLVSWVGVKK